jgi:hypothetical protein
MCTKPRRNRRDHPDFCKVHSDHAERIYDYRVRDKVIPMDGAMTVPGTEVVIDILEQLGDFKGKSRPKAEKYIDVDLLHRARKRFQ